jgi:hypothetical protein
MNLELILSILNCAIPPNSAIYVSVPITTGVQFVSWHKKNGINLQHDQVAYKDAHAKEVIKENVATAKPFIQMLRDSTHKIVIEPTELTVDNWSQENYHSFWQAVIWKFVDEIYFMDGWHLSKGCNTEFYTALQKGIPIFKQNNQTLSRHEGLSLIIITIKIYQENGLDTVFFEQIYKKIDALEAYI